LVWKEVLVLCGSGRGFGGMMGRVVCGGRGGKGERGGEPTVHKDGGLAQQSE